MPGPDVLQSRSTVRTHELPAIEGAVEVAQRRRHVIGLALFARDAVLVQDLPLLQTHRAPPSVDLSILLVRPRELPVSEQVVEFALVSGERGLDLLGRLSRGGLAGQR